MRSHVRSSIVFLAVIFAAPAAAQSSDEAAQSSDRTPQSADEARRSTSVAAQSDAGTPFVGAWTYAAQAGDVIGDAIERGIEDMSFITRPIARRRLRATNAPYPTVEVRVADGIVTTVLDGRAVSSPADGTTIRWTREDGEELQVATSLRNSTLVQTFTAEDGTRENVYSVSPEGRRLRLDVTIRSDRLPAPITYRLLYDRAH